MEKTKVTFSTNTNVALSEQVQRLYYINGEFKVITSSVPQVNSDVQHLQELSSQKVIDLLIQEEKELKKETPVKLEENTPTKEGKAKPIPDEEMESLIEKIKTISIDQDSVLSENLRIVTRSLFKNKVLKEEKFLYEELGFGKEKHTLLIDFIKKLLVKKTYAEIHAVVRQFMNSPNTQYSKQDELERARLVVGHIVENYETKFPWILKNS